MTSPPVRLVALDLDGTLCGADLRIGRRTRAAIAAVQGRGIAVTLATGRMFRAAVPFARELSVTAPLICYQGALVAEPESGRYLLHRSVPLPLARAVLDYAREARLHVNVYVDDTLYVERITPEAEFYARLGRVECHPVGDLQVFLQREPTKMVLIADEERTSRVVAELQASLGRELYVTRSYPLFTEVTHPACSKALALAFLAETLGVPREQVMAIGDNLNDLEMVRWAGTGVAMGNASPEVKAAAGHVTAALDQEGAALALERLVLAGPGLP